MSFYVCRSARASDRDELLALSRGTPNLEKWVRDNRDTFLRWEDTAPRLLTVLQLTSGKLEAFLAWIFYPALEDPDGLPIGPVWRVEAWCLSSTSAHENGERSYASGRAVELIYHTFNQANMMNPSVLVTWPDVDPALEVILDRAEFDPVYEDNWSRKVRPLYKVSATGDDWPSVAI